jgi:hypothetical protein
MQACVEPERQRNEPALLTAEEVLPEQKPGTAGVALLDQIPGLVYDLRLDGGRSNRFYADVAAFSALVLAEIDLRAGTALDGYIHHVQVVLREPPRSRGEYAIELLTLGQAVTRYGGAAETTPAWEVTLARLLFWLRRRPAQLKPVADLLRAAITRLFLVPRIGRKATGKLYPLNELPGLIKWLEATGEFEQEAVRLHNWQSFLGTLSQTEAERWIKTAAELFDWFRHEADRALGAYTRGVSRFLTEDYARRGCREDQIFCGKEPAEYHLCMVAAEIMNRGLQSQFEATGHKAILVPACMRGEAALTCKARENGVDITCAGCNPHCAVNRITQRMRALGEQVYLVPHASGFSRWLERWQREPDTGVVAVACLLNILPGGYEMRARQIPSQCVPLDYPGCRKHWRRRAIATGLNEERLVQLVQLAPSPRHS